MQRLFYLKTKRLPFFDSGAAVVLAAVAFLLIPGLLRAQIPSDWGSMKLVQEIDCSAPTPQDKSLFQEYPEAGTSVVEPHCGVGCRVMKPLDDQPAFFAYKIGKGLGLKPGKAYVLSVWYPEDDNRTIFIHNRGNEVISGLAVGNTTGDVMTGRYVNHNPESLSLPLSGKLQAWTGLFFLHDRFSDILLPKGTPERKLNPEDGFWVIISQMKKTLDPTSAGAAVAKIQLYEVEDETKLTAKINYPPEDLPKRYLFWREEMADNVVDMKSDKPEEKIRRGLDKPLDWYEFKLKWSRAMGVNAFCKDLLEFGYNQGWDGSKYGGNSWMYQPHYSKFWDDMVALCAEYGFPILPYYEYSGSVGSDPQKSLGPQKRAQRLNNAKEKNYTHIWWCERHNVDITDPATLEDFGKILDCTIFKYKEGVKTRTGKTVRPEFLGVWLRTRPASNPISFSDSCLIQFAKEKNGRYLVEREDLMKDKELLEKYYRWWFGKRADYLESVAKLIHEQYDPKAFVLYTTDSSEPGRALETRAVLPDMKDPWKCRGFVVTDNKPLWDGILSEAPYAEKSIQAVTVDQILSQHAHEKSLKLWLLDWGNWEVGHANPPSDPESIKKSTDAMFSYTINRFYSADSAMEEFRTGAGLTCVRHFPLNENEMDVKKGDKSESPVGYFISDVERFGAFSVMPEVAAVAKGDPTRLGYLTGSTFQHGFPRYVRAFNQAYLALPALPSVLVQQEKYGKEWVRKIDAGSERVWYAVCNLAYTEQKVQIDNLPKGKALVDCVSGDRYPVLADGSVSISFGPMSLRSFRVQ